VYRGDAGTTRQTCAPLGDARASFQWRANLDWLTPDSTLRGEFEQWRFREGHFGGGYVFGHAAAGLPTRWSDAEFPPSAAPGPAPAQSERRRWTLQRDGNHPVVGRRRRAALRLGAPPSRRGLTTEKDGVEPIGPHVLEEGAARRHSSDRSCSAGPLCLRAPWAGSKKAPEDET
jgi:hypothetical protein